MDNKTFLLERGWQELADGRFGWWVSGCSMLAFGEKEAIEFQTQTDEALKAALQDVPAPKQDYVGFSISGTTK